MESNTESYSLSFQQSIRNETKEKFDAILKTALKKKSKTQSKEQLIDEIESTTASSDNLLDKDEEYEGDGNFILNKFLNDTHLNNEKANDTFVKPPVPKPRKKWKEQKDSHSSNNTFEVTSPKILKIVKESDVKTNESSCSSRGTYNVKKEPMDLSKIQVASIPDNSNSSPNEDTYDVKKDVQEIGDLILHNSPSTTKIAILSTNSSPKIIEKGDIEQLIDNSSNSSTIHDISEDVIKAEKISDDSIENAKEIVKENKKKRPVSSKSKVDNEDKTSNNKYTYEKIVNIIIHKTEKLLINSFLIHPVVKMHIVDQNTGKYFPKSDKTRSVIFYYENDNDYIQPVMTHNYNLQEKRTLYPSWEETITINDDFNYLVSSDVILFFEILDFVSLSASNSSKIKNSSFKGWHRICFAFLKLVGKNDAKNVNKKLRLQLYYPNVSMKEINNECYLWKMWKSRKLRKYPSTLYVTIKSVIAPDKIIEAFRSKTPLQQEKSSLDFLNNPVVNNLNIENGNEFVQNESDLGKAVTWQKSTKFQLPSKIIAELDSYEEGCMVHKFSHDGLYLACAVFTNEMFYVVTYSVKSFEEVRRFACHQGIIYSIIWSFDDILIITGSADNTVAVWNFSTNSFLQILPHPSFVYAVAINSENVIVTGCFDGFVRIWQQESVSKQYNLHQELERHKGYVTSVSCSKKSTNFYSSDAVGQIFQWEQTENDWNFNNEIRILDLHGVVVNHIELFPNEKKLLVHSRDSTLRIVSLKNLCVLHWLRGTLNEKLQIFSSISACGNYVMSGSENGLITIWNAKTGKIEKTYDPPQFCEKSVTVHCVQFHPTENLISFSHHGSSIPILVYGYENTDDQKEELLTVPKGKTKFTLTSIKLSDKERKFDFKGILQKMDELLK